MVGRGDRAQQQRILKLETKNGGIARMKVVYTDEHQSHAPKGFILRGNRVACPEIPERAAIFRKAVDSHELVDCVDHGDEPVQAVHDADYLAFLKNGHQDWSQLPAASKEIIPNIHPNRNMSHCPDHVVGRAGYFQADTSCPIGAGTATAAMASAQCALTAADIVLAGRERVAYALCRPPGHHAYADMAGGFCFINNVAVAAQYCRDNGAARVAIIDVDVHHGNGTQGIFYHREDVLTISLHGDPNHFYPFYAGYADETGVDEGVGANRNVALEKATTDSTYLSALNPELDAIRQFSPDVLLVALGLDASELDPLAFLSITTQGFNDIGRQLSALSLPTVLVQEGGYVSEVLGANLQSFLSGFEAGVRS